MTKKQYEELGKVVEKAKSGDEEAFQYLYQYTQKRISLIAYNYTKNLNDVEDVVQEVYILIHKNISGLKDNTTFLHWVNQITNNYCYNFINKKSRDLEIPTDDISQHGDILSSKPLDPLDKVLLGEKNQLLQECIEKLPEKQRITLSMQVYSDLKYKEIAEVMGSTEHSVKKNLRMAKGNLKDIIKALPESRRNILGVRSFGGFTFYQLFRHTARTLMQEEIIGLTAVFYKGVIGLVLLGLGTAGGLAIYQHTQAMQMDLVETEEISESFQEPISVETESSDEVNETLSGSQESTGVEEVVLSHPVIDSWEVVGDYLELYVEDEYGIDYNNTYGVGVSGNTILPDYYDSEKGVLYFQQHIEDFTLHLTNTQGVVEIYKLNKY